MGVDINGIQPINEKGKWVGFNNLLWGAIWELCISITPSLRNSDKDWSHLGGKSFVIKNDEHRQLKEKLKRLLKKQPAEYHFKRYIEYLRKRDESEEALQAIKDFSDFINNNIGFVVS